VYISGALHGDEVIGPNAAFYFIEFIIKSYHRQDQLGVRVRAMLQNIAIVITPMTNSVGYHDKKRGERLASWVTEKLNKAGVYGEDALRMDPNRDFPFNVKSN